MMSDTSSSFTLVSSPIVETSTPKTVLGTRVKLCGSNYLLWAQPFRIFIGTRNKLSHLLLPPPAVTDPSYDTWLIGDYSMVTRLLKSLEEKISGSIIFLTTAKEMWDTLKVMYKNEKNLSTVFEIYERLFELKQGDKFVPEFYRELKSRV